MKSFKIFKQSNSCGLDLGQKWAKLACLKSKGKKVSLYRVGRLVWTKQDWEEKNNAAERLRQLCSSLKIKNVNIVTSITGHNVIIKRVDLPVSNNDKNLTEKIYNQSQTHIPFDMEDIYLDYQILGPGKTPETSHVVIVASKKKMVHQLMELFDLADIGTLIVDIDGFALSNCFEFNYPENIHETSYLLDIGSESSVFCVYSQNQPIFIRDMSFGGQQLTKNISQHLSQSPQSIEQLKLNNLKDLDSNKKQTLLPQLYDIYQSWAEEIKRLIMFYQSTYENAQQAKSLYLSGGGSLISALPQTFADYLNINVDYINPLRNIDCDPYRFDLTYLKDIGPQFTVPVGLALRSIL
ncbi:MAG TPA: type IV pilus assembly protein PilM [Desulfohalobiaceae bacterium]|nr:type IV pilus assembly protein PilM [Desulfohalobiaceae bacterium]